MLRSEFRLHLTPGRDTDRLFLLKEGDKVELLQRTIVSKAVSSAPPPPVLQASAAVAAEKQDANEAKEEEKEYKATDKPAVTEQPSTSQQKAAKKEKLTPKEKAKHDKFVAAAPAVPMEDWWLVRSAQGHAGWVLAHMVDIDVPIEIGQYAEGQRIVEPQRERLGYELDKDVPYYLVLLTEPRDGLPFDYNQIRLFSWNAHKHRYETAYRQRNIFGMLPVSVGKETFEKLGEQPTFTIRVRDDNGGAAEQKYRLEGVIVKRVLAPGETPVKAARAIAMGAKRKPLIAQP